MSEKGKNNPVYIQFKEEKTETGDSKFFGAPDLPEDFEWPVDEEEYDLEFICQINCAEAFKHNNMMPEKGMLYFFGCIANPLGYKDAPEIKAGFQSERNFSVIYESHFRMMKMCAPRLFTSFWENFRRVFRKFWMNISCCFVLIPFREMILPLNLKTADICFFL